MTKKRTQRLCSRFFCRIRGGKFCCADCLLNKRLECDNPCLNDPSRCKLEDKTRKA